jgi:hypothetical protein
MLGCPVAGMLPGLAGVATVAAVAAGLDAAAARVADLVCVTRSSAGYEGSSKDAAAQHGT